MDVICIDAEHAPFSRKDIDSCVLACRSVGLPAIVRLPATRAEHILNALDIGADGFIAPHMMTREDAQFIVKKSRYGQGRGYAGGTRNAGIKSMKEVVEHGNASATVIGQIEDVEALENLDEILSIDGIDCFFIGRSDLTISMGLTDSNDPKVISAIEDICREAKAKGRVIGTFTANLDEILHWRRLGISLFLLGSDQGLMLNGAKSLSSTVRPYF